MRLKVMTITLLKGITMLAKICMWKNQASLQESFLDLSLRPSLCLDQQNLM